MREEDLLLIQQTVTKVTTSLSSQHSAVIWDSTTLPRISKLLANNKPLNALQVR